MRYSGQILPTPASDEEIVKRILQGEKNLYEILIRKFNQRLFRICMSIVNDDMATEDIMQTTYLNAYLQLPSFQGKSSFGTWLTRIAINESLLHRKLKTRSDKARAEHACNEFHNETPLKRLMNQELKAVLEKAVSSLPEKYRLIFVMREIQEMTTQETMEVLDLTESNVKVRLNRAKEMLRTELSSYCAPNQLFVFDLVRCDAIVKTVMGQIRSH